MNYLQIVQKALKRAGVRNDAPDTLVDAIGIVDDFKEWAQDSWRELQEEDTNWWFRQKLDDTFAVTASLESYSMPTDLETLNYRTVSIYTVARQDEVQLDWVPYEEWRILKDLRDGGEGHPRYITETPAGEIRIWPVPAVDYTIRFDGVWDIDAMELDTDTPGFNRTGAQTLPDRYHYALVWLTVMKYCEHHQDAEGYAKGQKNFLKIHNRLKERSSPAVWVRPGRLTGYNRSYRSLR